MLHATFDPELVVQMCDAFNIAESLVVKFFFLLELKSTPITFHHLVLYGDLLSCSCTIRRCTREWSLGTCAVSLVAFHKCNRRWSVYGNLRTRSKKGKLTDNECNKYFSKGSAISCDNILRSGFYHII